MAAKKIEVPAGWGNPEDIFGEETVKTKVSNIIMGKKDDQKDDFGGTTNQTMQVSVANPNGKKNPFDNDNPDPFGGNTIGDDPFGGDTVKGNLGVKINPFDEGAKVPDPFGGDTIPGE